MFWTKTPGIVKSVFRNLVWDIPVDDKVLFLTFDDGPTPGITDFVLKTLEQYDALATFFFLGKNIDRYPELFQKTITKGHSIGNHTCNHINGWKTDDAAYFREVETFPYETHLFRPPYGRITLSQISHLKSSYSIIMWDVLVGDFNHKISEKQCAKNVIQHAEPGSIVVFHDSVKARSRIEYALPKVLEHFSGKGYGFEKL